MSYITTINDFIPAQDLTRRQREVLQALADGEELVYERRGGTWFGLQRTNKKILDMLIRYCCISQDSTDKDVQHWNINDTGRMCLAKGKFFIHKDFLKTT